MTELLEKAIWLDIIENLCCLFPESQSKQEKEMLKKQKRKSRKVGNFAI